MYRSLAKILCLIYFYEIDKDKLRRYVEAFHERFGKSLNEFNVSACEEMMMKLYHHRLATTNSFESLFTEEIPLQEDIFKIIPFDVMYETAKGYMSSIKGETRYQNVRAFTDDYINLFLNKKLNMDFDPKKISYDEKNKNHLIALNFCLLTNLIAETETWLINQEINEDTFYVYLLKKMEAGDDDVLHYIHSCENDNTVLHLCWELIWNASEEITHNNPDIIHGDNPVPAPMTA